MNLINKDKDNIISIVKALKPIDYLYSKQNKDYDKIFRSSSLRGLIKQINSRPKYNEFLKPGESLEELNHKNKTIMNINFKSTFNYIEELSNLKNLPMVLLDKNIIKRGRFNSDYEEDMNHSKGKSKNDKKKKKKLKIQQIRNSGDADVTLDPGRYHPNYNFIKKRYPCAYLGKPKSKEKTLDKDIKNENEEEKKGKNLDNDYLIKSSKMSYNKRINFYETISNKAISFKTKTTKNKKMNYSSSNCYSMPKSSSINKKIKILNDIRKKKIKSVNKMNEYNTVSFWSHTMDLDRSKKFTDQIKVINDKNKTNNNYFTNSTGGFKKIKKISKNTSAANLRCPIVFDKMPGRDRPINFVDGGWEGCRTNYNPDYNIIRPHIPSIIFKNKRKYQNFKKYITGKIIRSYCYSPDKYFVFEIKENKENEVSGKYGTIILKS